ncbi:HAMP domain-containing sensor histidine kinase [Halorubrum sp. SD626R]|jgi:signal transduction histidine kinase|uniref:sensor histidine kinase n=1 Tax=Halorubrum sp. SD626R TaxID=1419722 RepID=UPI000AE53F14|nr:GAF domain-containing sensor histidine kinase [Halorubrum sp. SD626R]TKX79377.1 sensor histidine kinase [Halorubrum sp. SD626R]
MSEGISEGDALRRMYRITADQERSFEEKLPELLDLGRAYLDVETGFLTEIDDETQVIVDARGDHELLQAGRSCPLSKAYCRRTVDLDGALTVQHARVEGWESDAAYEEFGLEAYIGAKVVVNREVYGTFCFADTEARDRPFSDDEETFVELLAQWVGYELFRKQATDRMQRQRDQLEEFTRVVSHDIRNPLGIVDGYLDMAERTGDPEHFQRCRDAVDRMESLIDDLLFLTREGQTIGGREEIDLAALADESWSFVGAEAATLSVETDRVVLGDWSRLQQVFENLFRNSVEHGGSDVTVRVGDLPDGSGIYVEDDGKGIPEDERDDVFVDGYSTAASGTGLGLTIIQQVVSAHGWEVAVTESAEGGARFEISGMEFVESEPDGGE